MSDFSKIFDLDNNTKISLTDLGLSVKPPDPNSHNYQSARKLKASECIVDDQEKSAAFNLSESVAPLLRTLSQYRYEQLTSNNADERLSLSDKQLQHIENVLRNAPPDKNKNNPLQFLHNIPEKQSTATQFSDKEPLYRRYMRFSSLNNEENLSKILAELPKEWTVVELISPYNPNDLWQSRSVYKTQIPNFHMSILRNDFLDFTEVAPFQLRIKPQDVNDNIKPLFEELYSLLDDNFHIIENAGRTYTKKNIHRYWMKREDMDLRMKSVISSMDKNWLAGWRSQLAGKLLDHSLKESIVDAVDQTCADWGFLKINKKQKVLLCNIFSSIHNLTTVEVQRTIRWSLTYFMDIAECRKLGKESDTPTGCEKCVETMETLDSVCPKCLTCLFELVHRINLIDAIKAFTELANNIRNGSKFAGLKNAPRGPVILIVDELLDTFPWESLPILQEHPVTRIENIHFLYYLYKIHESRVVDGYFMVKPNNGRYLINPDSDLEKMEKRMSSFVSYWCPTWKGEANRVPQPEDFVQNLKDADFFLYCGHGDGCQYSQRTAGGSSNGNTTKPSSGSSGGGAGVEEAYGTRAVVLLSGCGSVRLSTSGGRVPPLASHYHYHIAGSPLVIGMLWVVTDLEVDKVVSTILALGVPSSASVPWDQVGKAQWSQGLLDLNVETKDKCRTERDLLLAIAKARRSSNFVMISSSVVARGIPVRMEDPPDSS